MQGTEVWSQLSPFGTHAHLGWELTLTFRHTYVGSWLSPFSAQAQRSGLNKLKEAFWPKLLATPPTSTDARQFMNFGGYATPQLPPCL